MKRILMAIAALIAVVVVSAQFETLQDLANGAKVSQPFLFNTYLGVDIWQWLGLGLLSGISVLVGSFVYFAAVRITLFRDRFAAVPMTRSVRADIARSAGLLVGSLFANLLLTDLALRPSFHSQLEVLVSSVALLGVVLLLYGCWDAACDTLASRAAGNEQAERLLVPLTRKLVRATIVVAGIFAAIALYGGTRAVATIIGTLGIGGLVVALAAKDSVENLFGSLTILFDMPFALGDWVKIDKVEGAVEQINLRSTRIRTGEDTVILLPNANLIRASVENFGVRRFRRAKLTVRLSHECRLDDIQGYVEAIKDVLAREAAVIEIDTEIVLTDPQEQTIGLLVDCRLNVNTYHEEMSARSRILGELVRLRREHRIAFGTGPVPESAPTKPS